MNDTLTGVKSVNDSQEGLLIAYSLAERLEDVGESNWQILSLYFIIESYHLLYPASVLVGYTYFFAFSKKINLISLFPVFLLVSLQVGLSLIF